MVLSPKGLVADITAVWALICMGPLMNQKIVRLGEVSTTEPANEFLLCTRRTSSLLPFRGGSGEAHAQWS